MHIYIGYIKESSPIVKVQAPDPWCASKESSFNYTINHGY